MSRRTDRDAILSTLAGLDAAADLREAGVSDHALAAVRAGLV